MIDVNCISKKYNLYPSPKERLKELLHPFSKKYHREFWALRDVSFQVGTGETVGIVGDNGSGKSTLLHIICGVLTPSDGAVSVRGRISSLLELGTGFHPDYSGRENVYMNGAIAGMSKSEMDKRFPIIEAFADIGEFIDQPARTYSSGMFVRLAMAAALNIEPDIIVIDEALAVGDAYFQQKCITRLRQFKDEGKTMLFVSHDPSAVRTLCQRAILLEHGRVLMDGSPREVLDYYQGRLLQKMQSVGSEVLMSMDGEDTVGLDAREEDGAGAYHGHQMESKGKGWNSFRVGTGEAVLERLELLDENGRMVDVLESEQLLKIRVTVQFLAVFEDPHIGFFIRNRLGVSIFETNTYAARKKIGQVQRNETLTVTFAFRCILREGDYAIGVGVASGGYGEGLFESYISLEHDVRIIKVVKNPGAAGFDGIVNLSPNIDWVKTDGDRHDTLYRHHGQLQNEAYRKYLFPNEQCRPVMLMCETVNICSNDCIICAYGRMKRKKEMMAMDVFEKVLSDYSDMGGGVLSLTPVVGDVFLDDHLLDRLHLIERYEKIHTVSFTTNALFSDTLSDEDLRFVLERVDKIYISLYGMDRQECSLITARDPFERMIRSVKRIIGTVANRDKLYLGFRLLRDRAPGDVAAWVRDTFGGGLKFGFTREYANWGNTLGNDAPLSLQGVWAKPRRNHVPCSIPLMACQVLVNGDVSYCPCCDYDGVPELFIGNVREESLADIFNGARNDRLWESAARGELPEYCRHCTFHRPLDELLGRMDIFARPLDFMGA